MNIKLKLSKRLSGLFLKMGFNYLKAKEKLREGSLLFTIPFPGVPGTQVIDLGKMKS